MSAGSDASASVLGQGQIDRVALCVDDCGVVDEELERLASGDIRAYRLQHPPLVEIAPHPVGLFAQTLGQTVDLGVELVVGRLDLLLGDDGPQAEVGEHRFGRSLADPVHERRLILAGRREVLRDVDALRLEPVHEVVEAALHVLWTSGSGASTGTSAGELVEHPVAQRHLRLELADHLDALARRRRAARRACRTR